MSDLGDLLEAIHDAPHATTLRGTAQRGQDPDGMRAAVERFNTRGGGFSTHMTIGGGLFRSPAGMQNSVLEFWWSQDAWRMDIDDTRVIAADGQRFTCHPGTGGIVDAAPPATSPFDGLGLQLVPSALLGGLRIASLVGEVVLNRPCWRVKTSVPETSRPSLFPFFVGGEDFEFWVDRAVGIVMRCEGRLDGDLVSTFEIEELVVDEPMDSSVFAFVTPDGSPLRTQEEMLIDMLRDRGADVSQLDPTDSASIHDAMRTVLPFHQVPDMSQLAAHHIATGPPPADEENARIDVGVAFERMGQASDDGRAVPSVQAGDNLGPSLTQAQSRNVGGAKNQAARFRVELVKFLHDREAVVWFSVLVNEQPLLATAEGRAVLVDGAWKVSRPTFVNLMTMAGATCPPPVLD